MKTSPVNRRVPSLRSLRTPLLVGLLAPGAASAQTPPAVASTNAHATELPPVVITATPIPSSLFDLAQPVNVLEDTKLREQLRSTLGETLSRQPGINSTYFGPNASRPIIRGLGGDRIRILQNGLGTMDVSNTSDDHAVAVDPLSLTRIEVVRGPAALMYGPNAIGGVVNQIDNRIPDRMIKDAITGMVEGRFDSPANGKSGSLLVEGGSKHGINYHFDAFRRHAGNVSIPGLAWTPAEQATRGATGPRDRLPGSQSISDGATGGASYVWDKGYFGGAFQGYNNDYGAVAEPGVNIRLHQRRWDLAGAFLQPIDAIQSIRWKIGRANYKHTEYDAGAAGTIFNSDAYNGRLEVLHKEFGRVEGSLGYEIRQDRLTAIGAEAFLPPNQTGMNSLFAFEEVKWDKLSLQFGGRVDFVGAEADAVPGHPNNFFPTANSRSFTTGNGSLGVIYRPVEAYSAAVNFSFSQRAPTTQELYSKGPHTALGTFEIGNPNFNPESNFGIDFSVRRETGHVTGSLGVFYNRFNNFMTLTPSTFNGNANVDDAGNAPAPGGDSFRVMEYRGLAAEFIGAEGIITVHLLEEGPHRLHVDLKSDYVRARDARSGAALPRISPLRYGAEVGYSQGAFSTSLEAQRVERQSRVSAGELATPGYVMLNAGIAYKLGEGKGAAELSLRGMNLLDQEARNHVSFLKEIAPLPGRGVLVSLRFTF